MARPRVKVCYSPEAGGWWYAKVIERYHFERTLPKLVDLITRDAYKWTADQICLRPVRMTPPHAR